MPLLWLVAVSWFEHGRMVVRMEHLVWSVGIVLVFLSMVSCIKVVPREKRGLWVIVLFLGNYFALPLFWLWYIRPYFWDAIKKPEAV